MADTADVATEYLQAKSVWITGVLQEEVLAKAKLVLLDAVRRGLPLADINTQLDAVLRDFLPQHDSAGRAVNLPQRIETIARTNVSDAINAARTVVFSDPENSDSLMGLQYSAILDNRVRPNHAAWDGVIKPVDFWIETKREPPCGFNCRCILVPVAVQDDATITLDSELPKGQEWNIPDPGFK